MIYIIKKSTALKTEQLTPIILSVFAAMAMISSLMFAERAEAANERVDDYVLEEIIVTTRRREESLLDVPESISVFEAQIIEDAEIDEIADFAQLTPGVVVQQGFQGGDRPIVVFRGVGQVGGSAPSVIILSDGIYMPAGDPLRNQLFDIQQIEVVKGPQGSLYGRDTIGGVINVISKEPEEEFGGQLQLSYLHKAKQAAIKGVINIPLIEDVLYSRISAGFSESDGFFTNAAGADQDFREESYLRSRFLLMPNEQTRVDVRFGYNKFDNGYNAAFFSSDADTTIDDIGFLNAVDYDRGFNKREVTDAAVKLEIELDDVTVTSISQIVDSEQNLVQDADFNLAPGLQIVRDSLTKEQTWSQELRLTSASDVDIRWLAGVFYETTGNEFQFSDTEINLLGFLTGGSNELDTERHAIFAQVDADLSEHLTASLALRYDDTQRDLNVITPVLAKASDSTYRMTPKFSLTYNWTDKMSTYVTYGEGFRSGGFDAVTNIPFADEELKSYELGLKATLLENRLNLTAAAYRIDYSDQQVSVLTTDPGSGTLLVTTVNLGESETTGLELALQYQATDNFVVSVAADVMDTEILKDPDPGVKGNETPFSTDYTLSTSGQYTVALNNGLSIVNRISYYYQGDQTWDKANTMVQDAYGTLAARVALEGESWFIALSGENLLDEQYNDQLFTNFGVPGLNAVYPGLPRRWTITVSNRF